MGDEVSDSDDVLVVIDHPFGQVEWSLARWIATGPGPRNARPVSARSRSTGQPLPLTVIPLAYRNTRESRALIAAGRIESPWPGEAGDLAVFDRQVADPQRVDRVAAQVLAAAPAGRVDAQAAGSVLAVVPEFADLAPIIVRRLAAEARWDQFDTVIGLAGAAGLVTVGPALCEVLGSDARPPRPTHIVEVLGQRHFDDAAQEIERLIARYVYADQDLTNVRQCMRVMATAGQRSRIYLTLLSWHDDWPTPIAQWAAEELDATGERIPPPLSVSD
jgi:hypothetical protein